MADKSGYQVKDSTGFDIDTLLTSGIVKRSYWIIPNKFSVTFRTLLTKEATQLREKLIREKGDNLNLLSFNFEFMLNQIVAINDEEVKNPEDAREKIGMLAANLADKIQECYNQFVTEVNALLGES